MSNETALKLLKQSLIVGDKTALIREAIRELEELEPETLPGLTHLEQDKTKILQAWIEYVALIGYNINLRNCCKYNLGNLRRLRCGVSNNICSFKTCPYREVYIEASRSCLTSIYPELFIK
jgi:hypothetical protein